MAKMTIGDIVAELNARGFSAFATAEKERYANWAYFDVARSSRMIEEQVETDYNFTAGMTQTSLTQRSVKVVADVTNDGAERRLMPMTDDEFIEWRNRDLTQTQWWAAPQSYYIWDEKLWVSPLPEKARVIRAYGWSGVTELASGGIPLTHQDLDPAIVHRALYYCFLRAFEADNASAAAATAETIIYDVLGEQGLQMDETEERVEPDRGWGI